MAMPQVPARAKHTASVIFLHGLGDTGHGWCQGFEEIAEPFIKYLFPTAKIQPVSLNLGMRMPSWFDIKSLNFNNDEDKAGIQEATKYLNGLVKEEIQNGIPAERIIIGGFSQGGAVALHAAFTSELTFGGVIALSTWLPLHATFPLASTGKNMTTPIFQGHGNQDPVVNHKYGVMTHEYIKKMNNNATFSTYAGVGHSSCNKEMSDVKAFLKKCLSS
eukprot:gene4550-5148_t